MTTYTPVFGSQTIPPAGQSYVAVALSASTTFEWPELSSAANLMADIMEITPTAAWDMTFPAANVVSTGRDVLVRNIGSFTVTLKDTGGNVIGTVAAGAAKYVYLTSNATASGVWTIFTFGTGTSAADAAALAGYGTLATGATLSQNSVVSAKVAAYTVAATDQATTITFANTGVVACNLPAAAGCVSGFFCYVSNQGTGSVTIDPSGAELINGAATLTLAPQESCMVVCTGTAWVSIGYGRSTNFQFTKLVLDITAGTPFTLTSAQAQNKLIQTIGVIGAGVTINMPAVVGVYYIQCSHTGAFTTTFKTAAGTGVVLNAADRAIIYCDGVDIVAAQTASAPATTLTGGVAGSLVYQSAANVTAFSSAGVAGQIVLSGGVGAPTFITKDATDTVAGLTLFKINFKNALNTFTSFFTNANTAARTYTFQDRNGTIADDTNLAGKAALAGANFTGGINGALSTVASAATPDIFATTVGNLIDYTGTATCTGFVAAPQAGCERTLVCAGAAVFTAGANMLIDGVASASNFMAAAGDKIIVRAVSTTQFRLTPQRYSVGEFVSSSASGVALTTGTAANITSISLTAGVWDVQAKGSFSGNVATTITYAVASISATSASFNDDGIGSYTGIVPRADSLSITSPVTIGTPFRRVTLTATTTYYLVVQIGFAVSTCTGSGGITARRVAP